MVASAFLEMSHKSEACVARDSPGVLRARRVCFRALVLRSLSTVFLALVRCRFGGVGSFSGLLSTLPVISRSNFKDPSGQYIRSICSTTPELCSICSSIEPSFLWLRSRCAFKLAESKRDMPGHLTPFSTGGCSDSAVSISWSIGLGVELARPFACSTARGGEKLKGRPRSSEGSGYAVLVGLRMKVLK